MSFDSLGLHPLLLEALNNAGYDSPTEIQSAAIPHILKGQDVMAGAQTGTGKTAAFALPILHKLINSQENDTSQVQTPLLNVSNSVSAENMWTTKESSTRAKKMWEGVSMSSQAMGKADVRWYFSDEIRFVCPGIV